MIKIGIQRGTRIWLTAVSLVCVVLPSRVQSSSPGPEPPPASEPVITVLRPERAAGRGYRLEYTVDAPLDVTWKFKTDFDSPVLTTNKMILSNRVVSRRAGEVVTETVYSNKPKLVFRWKTTLIPDQHRMEFVLLNPGECGEDYHYGDIRLQALGGETRITQVAYFDFFGASLWVKYPFRGGMSQFLGDTVRWEQQAVAKYRNGASVQ
jgi:hypothetical protein